MAMAGGVSLLDGQGLGAVRGALYAPADRNGSGNSASLFIGRDRAGLFADPPAHDPAFPDATLGRLSGRDVDVIRALIMEAESRRDGYDAVQHGARIPPPRPPTQMTIAQIYQWIEDTPGQPHAIGKYQFVPKTLVRVVEKAGVDPGARFSPAVQDRLGDVLLSEAGLNRFRAGTLSRVAFMNNLAKIWAGLPNASGKSHYHGYAGNKASISWARFDTVMRRIDPKG